MTGLRNLSSLTQFKVFVPDISREDANRNVPWVMRVDVPENALFLEVVEIDYPLNPLMGVLGPSPKKTIGYAYQFFRPLGRIHPVFITSVFTGTDVPWPAGSTEPRCGDLQCRYLGTTSHTGILLVHLSTRVYDEGLKEDPVVLADELEEEMEDTYLIVRPKEYDLDKRLLMLMQAGGPAGSVEEKIAEAAKAPPEAERGKT